MEKGGFRRFQVGEDFATSVPGWFSWKKNLVRWDGTVVDRIVEGKVGTEMSQEQRYAEELHISCCPLLFRVNRRCDVIKLAAGHRGRRRFERVGAGCW
jgi:hypothetical protein